MATMSEPEPDRTHPAYRLNGGAQSVQIYPGVEFSADELIHRVPVAASTVSDRSDEQAGGTPEVPPGTSEGSDLDPNWVEAEEAFKADAYHRFNTYVNKTKLLETLNDNFNKQVDEVVDQYIVTDPETGGMKGQKLARFSQIPPDVLLELAEHFGKGELKYPNDEDGKANWQRGYSWRLSVDALGRHLLAFLAGEDMDPDSGSSHLIAVMWHCATLRWFQLNDKGKDYR